MRTLLAAVTVVCHAMSALAAANDPPSGNPPVTAAPAPATKVDLNSATVETLGKLDGISAARAKAIVENRCYESATDLVDRRILPKSVFQKIKDQLETSATCVRDEPVAGGDPKKRAK
jgi:DNA uptake protein ComE-like DNA-binding protein